MKIIIMILLTLGALSCATKKKGTTSWSQKKKDAKQEFFQNY